MDNITLTLRLPNGQSTKLGELRDMIEGRTGLSLNEHWLMVGAKPFQSAHGGMTVAEYGVQCNQMLFLQGTLKGGFGECAVIADVVLRDIRHGNVLSDIEKTAGESKAKKDFGRMLLLKPDSEDGKDFRAKLFQRLDKAGSLPKGVASDAELRTWMSRNTTFLLASASRACTQATAESTQPSLTPR